MDNKGFMGPRFASMPQMMPLKADGTEMTEEENKRFMMQHAGSMQKQPSHMQPRFPGNLFICERHSVTSCVVVL